MDYSKNSYYLHLIICSVVVYLLKVPTSSTQISIFSLNLFFSELIDLSLKFRNLRNNEKKLHLKFKESSDLIVNASSLFCFASQATQAKNPLIKIKSLASLVP